MIYEEDRKEIEKYHFLTEALELAARLHDGQFRKDNITPYIVHPMRVMMMVSDMSRGQIGVKLAALFHDVKEDCGEEGMKSVESFLSIHSNLLRPFEAGQVYFMVNLLTLDKSISRKERIESCIGNIIASRSHSAAFIKLCDRLDNLRTMKQLDFEFQKDYLKETEVILKALYTFAQDDIPCQIMWDNLRREYDYWMENMGGKKS